MNQGHLKTNLYLPSRSLRHYRN